MLDTAIPKWRGLGDPAPDRLSEARQALHWAVQLVASVGNTCIRPLDDGSHLGMTWLAEKGMLAGVYTTATPRFRAALRVSDLTLHLLDDQGQSISSTDLPAKTLQEGLERLGAAILSFTGAPPSRPLRLPTAELPAHPVETGEPLRLAHPSELEELARWFGNADAMLRVFAEKDERASAVRCWPRRLDLCTQVVLDEGVELERARSVTVGMSPGEPELPAPHFFVVPHPRPTARDLRPLPEGARWREDDVLAALLPAAAVVEPREPAEQARRVAGFLEQAFEEVQRLFAAR